MEVLDESAPLPPESIAEMEQDDVALISVSL